jgi:lipase
MGHGKTPRWQDFKVNRPYQVSDDLDLLASVLREAESPVDLVGHSFGGALCVAYAIKFPHRVRRMVLIEPNLPTLLKGFDPVEWERFGVAAGKVAQFAKAGNGEESAKACFEYNLSAAGWASLPEKVRSIISKLTLNAIAAQTAALAEFSPDLGTLGKCNFPILILVGTNTCTGLRRMSEAFQKLVPNSRLEWVEGAGHMLPSTHATAVNREAVNFLGFSPSH